MKSPHAAVLFTCKNDAAIRNIGRHDIPLVCHIIRTLRSFPGGKMDSHKGGLDGC